MTQLKHGDGLKDDPRRVNDRAADAIGSIITDGSIFAGISPDTGEAIYAKWNDAPLTMTFNEASDYANKLNKEKYLGHDDWRLPTKNELKELFTNRAAIGGFDSTGDRITGWYWSSSSYNGISGWSQQFSDGSQAYVKNMNSSVRLVRCDASKAARVCAAPAESAVHHRALPPEGGSSIASAKTDVKKAGASP